KRMVAARDTARDLHIDDTVVHAIAADGLVHDDGERGRRHWKSDAQLAQRAPQPFEVAALIDQPASPHLANLVDAVGELIATILDMNHSVARRQIAAIHI